MVKSAVGISIFFFSFLISAMASEKVESLFLCHFDTKPDADYAFGKKGRLIAGGEVRLVEGRFGKGVRVDRAGKGVLGFSGREGNIDWEEGTLEFWLKPDWSGGDVGKHYFFLAGETRTRDFAEMYYEGGRLRFRYYDTDWHMGQKTARVDGLEGSPLLKKGQWSHLAFSWNRREPGKDGSNRTELDIYLNGRKISGPELELPQNTVGRMGTPSEFYIGTGDKTEYQQPLTLDAQSNLDGVLDELRISPAAMKDFSQRGKPLTDPDPERNLQAALELAKSKDCPAWAAAGPDLYALRHYTFDPKIYDLWFGKKDRIYLTGLWKLRKVLGPNASPQELANDPGSREGFYREDYDDTSWDFFPIPWSWRLSFTSDRSNTYPPAAPTSAGWYRREFRMDTLPEHTRIILQFEQVTHDAKVYVNGQYVGEHMGLIPYGNGPESTMDRFAIDITRAAKLGRNVLAVKAGEVFPEESRNGPYGGIWQPVWIDIRPEVYCEQALITFSMKAKKTTVRCRLVNTTGRPGRYEIGAELKPWVSDRYKMSGGAVTKLVLGRWEIPAGTSERTFDLNVKDPVLWNPERPFLYHLILTAGPEGGKSFVLGQERFGLREFRTDQQYFRLNGMKAYLPGECIEGFGYNRYGATDGASNGGKLMETCLRRMKASNTIYIRNHSSRNSEVFYDLCDEIGLLVSDEMQRSVVGRVMNHKNTVDPELRQWLRSRLDANYNHPSVVIYSMGNEKWDGGGTFFQPALDALLDCCRAIDSTRPMTGSSGRFCGTYGPATKNQIEQFHTYVGLTWGNWLTFEKTIQSYWELMVSMYGNHKVPILNDECLGFHRHGTYVPMLPAIKGNGEYDRKLYAELVPANIAKSGWIGEAGNLFLYTNMGLEDICNDRMYQAARAKMHKRALEGARRHEDMMAGYAVYQTLQCQDPSMFDPKLPVGEVYKAIQIVNAPLYAGLDWFNMHQWAGETLTTKLYVVNDTYHDVKPLTVTARLSPRGGKQTVHTVQYSVESITQGNRRVMNFELPLPKKIPTGWYRIILELREEDQLRHSNNYDIYIQQRTDIPAEIKCTKRIAVYPGKEITKRILDRLKISYTPIKEFSHLKDYDVLLIGADAVDANITLNGEKIRAWLEGGKRVIQLEQSKPGVLPWLSELKLDGAGISYTEPMTFKHPVFAGLDHEQMQAWNDGINVVNAFYTPMSECLLAGCGMNLGMFGAGSVGMSVLEPRVGKGVAILSQVEAVLRFDSDPVARKYVVNLLRYTLEGPWTDHWAGRLGGTRQRVRTAPIAENRCFFVNLRPYVNMGFRDDVEGDKQGGWTDQGRQDLRHFPTGRQILDGVPFDIINPFDNNGKSIIVLQGIPKPYFPFGVTGMSVNQKSRRLFFLYTGAYIGTGEKKPLAKFTVHYSGGNVSQSQIDIPLIGGINFGDWWGGNPNLPEATIVWKQVHPEMQVGTAIYLFEWKNPQPEGFITQIDFAKTSENQAIPILLAITGER